MIKADGSTIGTGRSDASEQRRNRGASQRLLLTKERADISVEKMTRVLCERISDRTLPPGSRIVEGDLCEEFSIGRSAAREVLTALQQRGLIARPLNRSAMVVGFTKSEILEVLDVREVLEGLCIRLATENAKPDSWQDIVDLFDGPLRDAVLNDDWESYIDHLRVFYRRIRVACKNVKLRSLLESIDDRSIFVVRRIVLLPGRMEQGSAELRDVMAAMRRGDAVAAEQLRRQNIRNQRAWFSRYSELVSR